MNWVCRLNNKKMVVFFIDSIFQRAASNSSASILMNKLGNFPSQPLAQNSTFSFGNTRQDQVSQTHLQLHEASNKTEKQMEDVLSWLINYESSLLSHLGISTNMNDAVGIRKKILRNFQMDEFLDAHLKTTEFNSVKDYLEQNYSQLGSKQCLSVLKSLTNIGISFSSTLMNKLYAECVKNIDNFDIKELALFSQCAFIRDDISTLAQIIPLFQRYIESDCIQSSVCLSDLSILFQCLSHLMSSRLLDKCVSFTLEFISHRPYLDLPSISLLCNLAEGSNNEAKEMIQERIMESCILSMKTDFSLQDLDIESCATIAHNLDSLFGFTSLQSELRRLFSGRLLENNLPLNPDDAMKMFFFQPPRYISIHSPTFEWDGTKMQMKYGQTVKSFIQSIEQSDNHYLIQSLRLFSQTKLSWKIVSAIHSRLDEIWGSPTDEQLLLLEQDEEMLLLLYHFVQMLTNQGFQVSTSLTGLISKLCQPAHCQFPVSKARASLIIHAIVLDMFKDIRLLPRELDLFLTLMNQLPISTLIFASVKLEMGARKDYQSLSSHAKAQMRHLSRQSRKCLQDKLSSSYHLPANPLKNARDIIWFPVPKSLDQTGILQIIIAHLEKVTRELEKCNCLRAVEILSAATMTVPMYKPLVFENLLQFMYNQQPMPVLGFLGLIQVLSSSSYLPNDMYKFKSTCLSFQEDVHEKQRLSLAQQVQLAHRLSQYRYYNEAVISSMLSEQFLSDFNKELKDLQSLHGYEIEHFQKCLFLLKRNVAVERPHLMVTPFTSILDDSGRSSPSIDFLESIKRIFQHSPHMKFETHSDYGHRIDALVCLNENGDVIDPDIPGNDVHYKLAFLYLSSLDMCYKAKERRTGHIRTAIRHLKILGYFVVEIPYHRLYGMDMYSEELIDNYVRERIINAIGPKFLFQ